MEYLIYPIIQSDDPNGEDVTLAHDYLTIAQAAAELNVNRATVRRWIDEEGRLSAESIGRERLIPRAQIGWLKDVPSVEMVLATAAMKDLGVTDHGNARFAPSGYGAANSEEALPRYLTMLADGKRKVVRVRLEEVEDITDKW